MLTRHLFRAPLTVLLPLFAGLVGCKTVAPDATNDVIALVQAGHYERAMVEAKELHAKRPDDPDAERLARDAEIAFLLDQGRQVTFAGDPATSLGIFRQALRLDPHNQVALGWVAKTRLQLAEDHLDIAFTLTGPDELREAEAEFEVALAYLPEGIPGPRSARIELQAKLGLVRVLHIQQYHETVSRSNFSEGLRNYRDLLMNRAKQCFTVAREHDPGNVRTEDRIADVEVIMANEEIAKALGLEEEGFFHAARNQYRMVLLIDPNNEVARDGLDRMDIEARASDTFDEAQMKIVRGEFDDAQQLIEDAGALTDAQDETAGILNATLEDARLREMYEHAIGLERDYLYAEAVEAFDELLADTEFYEDSVARRDTILEFIELATEYYANALAAETDEEARGFLRRIPVFWPDYRDVDERLRDIEGRLAATAVDGEDG